MTTFVSSTCTLIEVLQIMLLREGGNVDTCSNEEDLLKILFQYPQQTGLSVVSSDPIQMCFCESEKPNCYTSITVIPGIDVNISLATVGLNDGLY